MSDDHNPERADAARTAAAGSVDETSAFISACLATGEPTESVRRSIRSVLEGLQMSSACLREAGPPSPELLEYVRAVTDPSRTRGRPAGAATLVNPGHSVAASMLRLARVTGARAQRDVSAVGGTDRAVVELMSALPDLLEALAGELDAEEERSIPVGVCVQRG